MFQRIYTHALPFLILLAPLLPVSLDFSSLLHTAYPAYLCFFLSFFILRTCIQYRSTPLPITFLPAWANSALWYLIVLSSIVILMLSMHAIRFGLFQSTLLYGCLIGATLISLQKTLDTKLIFWRSCVLTCASYFAIIMAGFEALGLQHYVATGLYSLAVSLVVTGQWIVVDITGHDADIAETVKNPRTRKQRRKWAAHARAFSDTRNTRLTAGMLLLAGPIIISTMGMTQLFDRRFILLSLCILLFRDVLSNLLPREEVIDFPDNFLIRYTGLCYIFLGMILVLRFMPFL